METLIFIFIFVFIIKLLTPPKRRGYKRKPWYEKFLEKENDGRPIRAGRYKYDPDGEWPFFEKNLMTPTEEGFYQNLKEALPEYIVFSQVGLSRLIDVKKGHDYQQWFNRVSRMSVDYVIVDKRLRTIAAIELDDASHNTKQAKERDARKNKALAAAKIRLIRWHVKKMPDANEIRKTLGFDVSESVANTMEQSVE